MTALRTTIIAFAIYAAIHMLIEMVYASFMLPKLKKNKNSKPFYAFFGYLAYLLGTFYIVIWPILSGTIPSIGKALTLALMFGFAVYGVYNFTNLYLFENYNFTLAMVDLAFGIVSLQLLSMLAWYFKA